MTIKVLIVKIIRGIFFFLGSTSLSFAGSTGRLTWLRHSSCKSRATHFYQCVWYFGVIKPWHGCQCLEIFVVIKPWYGCQCLEIFNLRTDVAACDCTRGLYRHRKRVFTGSWLWEKNSLPHRGLEPASVLRLAFQSDALPTELSQTLVICFLLSQRLHHMLIYSCTNAYFYCRFICMNELYAAHRERFASRKNCTWFDHARVLETDSRWPSKPRHLNKYKQQISNTHTLHIHTKMKWKVEGCSFSASI